MGFIWAPPPLHAPSPRLFLLFLLNMGNVLTGVDRPFLHVWFRPIQINVDIQPTTEVCAAIPRCHSPLFPSDVRRRQWRLTCDPIWIDFPMTESFWEGERQGGTDTPFPSLSPSSLFSPQTAQSHTAVAEVMTIPVGETGTMLNPEGRLCNISWRTSYKQHRLTQQLGKYYGYIKF